MRYMVVEQTTYTVIDEITKEELHFTNKQEADRKASKLEYIEYLKNNFTEQFSEDIAKFLNVLETSPICRIEFNNWFMRING